MGIPEAPAQTDAEHMIAQNEEILARLDAQEELLQKIANGYNGTGANVQWIVDNVQGIFQMFSNPAFMSQMMGQMTGALAHGGQAGAGSAGDGGAEGTDG